MLGEDPVCLISIVARKMVVSVALQGGGHQPSLFRRREIFSQEMNLNLIVSKVPFLQQSRENGKKIWQ